MLCAVLNGSLIRTFYKLNIHAGTHGYTYSVVYNFHLYLALTPRKIRDFLRPICNLALDLQRKSDKFKAFKQPPLLTVRNLLCQCKAI